MSDSNVQPTPALITLNLLATKDDLTLLGNVLERGGVRFEQIEHPPGKIAYKIVKVKVLGEQETRSGTEDTGTVGSREPGT